ncbi:MAG: metallophosphoesterase [Candidatus Eisenbacteria bacterium]|uniref:Metallophosphoesterase n=1 Tax=Eiseniibacteriota bacterium TaxID=2212470 RepID=A0A956LXB4_UNCEI|nr:metallophosphoesterase [Candidatus Eisenbacteria bacterium]
MRALDHPTVEQTAAGRADQDVLRFVAYGDQRALADGEWQTMIDHIRRIDAGSPLAFILDTGDIVQDGRHSDQYWMLRGILEPVVHLPLLVAVGNHEIHNNDAPIARENTAAFLKYLDPAFSPTRMYYRKDIGPLRCLFLDSNDLVYGTETDGEYAPSPESDPALVAARVREQLVWLTQELAEASSWPGPVLVALHHPFVQSSRKHEESARFLWSFRPNGPQGPTFPEMLLEAGVDLVLVGHTHTYERFVLEKDGRRMQFVNLSGRPRTSFLWMGDGARRARDFRGAEVAKLGEEGWSDLDGWRIKQAAVMLENEQDQFAIFEVGSTGAISMDVRFLNGDDADTVRDSLSIPAQ